MTKIHYQKYLCMIELRILLLDFTIIFYELRAAATEANQPTHGGLGGREEGRRTSPPSGNRRPLNTMITENGLQSAKTCLGHKH